MQPAGRRSRTDEVRAGLSRIARQICNLLMGLDFRRSLIAELERRQHEIDDLLAVLRRAQNGDAKLLTERMANENGASKNGKVASRPKAVDLYSKIITLRQEGMSLREIAGKVNLSHAGVWKVLKRTR